MLHIMKQRTAASPPKSSDQDEWQTYPESPTQFETGCDQFLKRVDMNYRFKVYSYKNPFSLLQAKPPTFSLKVEHESESLCGLRADDSTRLCRWHMTALTGICYRKENGTLPFPPPLSWASYWRHLFLSIHILSLPLIFPENTRIVKIMVRMGLKSSPSAKTCRFLKHWSVTEKCWLDRTKACGHSPSARVDNSTIHIKRDHVLLIWMSLLYTQDDDAMKLPRRYACIGAAGLGMGHPHTLIHSFLWVPVSPSGWPAGKDSSII